MTLATDLKTIGVFRSHIETMGRISGVDSLKEFINKQSETTDFELCLQTIYGDLSKDVCDLAERLFTIATVSQTLGNIVFGYTAGKLVDTNKDASSVKTAVTAVGSKVVSTGVTTGAVSVSYRNSKLYELLNDLKVPASKLMQFRQSFTKLTREEKLTIFKYLGLNENNLNTYLDAMESATKSIRNTVLIYLSAELGLSSVSAYHGYHRSGLASAIGFFLLGGTGVGLGIAQGFAESIE